MKSLARGSGPPQAEFRKFVSAAFAQKRKTIFNNLKGLTDQARELIESAGIDPSARAESLALLEWLRLFDAFIQKDKGLSFSSIEKES